ncbi:tRNA pseudouridine(13) synthase TruD [Candidatus Woesearchaeota archaeon]|nr:tRNA pseudouridine(13) synthase TruD [Candidatus Woesearchaeota archaeon]
MFKIKTLHQDFIVKEKIQDDFLENGRYSYFIIKKIGINTLDAVKSISYKLKIPLKNIGYSGLKDKNAIAYQYISIDNVPPKQVIKLNFENLDSEFVGYKNKPLSIGNLISNDFKITVRNLDKEYKKIKFIENYFDEQRFSADNVRIGRAIIKRDFSTLKNYFNLQSLSNLNFLKAQDMKVLRLYISAYQSYLWNCVAADYLKKYDDFHELNYSLGTFIFLKKKVRNIDIPLINFDSKFYNKRIEQIYKSLLSKEQISINDFLTRDFPELINESDSRKLIIDLNIHSEFMKDEVNLGKFKQILEFELPKGSYATIAIKKMFS